MLSQKSYPTDYVDSCRRSFANHIKAFQATGVDDPAFETVFFNNLLVSLDAHFVHRMRGAEGKDGNPLNEARVIADSIRLHDGVLTEEKSITLEPETSMLGLEYGTTVALTADGFSRLCRAFLDEIEKRFPATD